LSSIKKFRSTVEARGFCREKDAKITEEQENFREGGAFGD